MEMVQETEQPKVEIETVAEEQDWTRTPWFHRLRPLEELEEGNPSRAADAAIKETAPEVRST